MKKDRLNALQVKKGDNVSIIPLCINTKIINTGQLECSVEYQLGTRGEL